MNESQSSPPPTKPDALRLIKRWAREKTYDDKAWPRLRSALKRSRLSNRPVLHG